MTWTYKNALITFFSLFIGGQVIAFSGVAASNKYVIAAGFLIAMAGIAVLFFMPESYEDTRNAPSHAKIPNLRVESALDNVNHSLILANKCNSIYGGAWQMGVETDCGKVRQNPNGF